MIPVFNIFMALKPFWGRPDDLSDIPLTPAQRALLGLGPSSVPPTPDTVYSTPPRYSRTPSLAGSLPNSVTSTPGSAGSTSMGVIGGGGGVGGGGGGAGGAGARYSPMAAAATSPLLQKAMAGGMTRRRSSIGSQGLSGAGAGSGVGGVGLPGLDGGAGATTSPSAGKRSSVTLNSKWLYEKGRRSSGSSWLH